MKLNTKKFFELAKENGLEAADINFESSSSLSVSIFHGEVDSYEDQSTTALNARGIYNGKFGSVSTEVIDKDTPDFLIKGIKECASYIESDDPCIIFKGSEKYHKKNLFNKAVMEIPISQLIDTLYQIEKKLYAYDKRINEVITVGFSRSYSESFLENSYGLKLKSKAATISFFGYASAKQGEEVRTGFDVYADFGVDGFDIDKFVKSIAESALKQLGSTQCSSGKYPAVLSPDALASILPFFLSHADAEEVQKQSSMFIGKVGQQIASKKLSVYEDPLEKSIFFRYCDDEGVATNKKFLIKKGVLENYLYTLETAAKAGVEPTGNGFRSGAKAKASMTNIKVKPGKKSEQEIMEDIKLGVYIDEFQGLHAGMNGKSGNFSLQSKGFMIRDGKLSEPLTLITTAGNLFEMFNNIKDVANNSKLVIGAQITTPSIRFKKLSISGK